MVQKMASSTEVAFWQLTVREEHRMVGAQAGNPDAVPDAGTDDRHASLFVTLNCDSFASLFTTHGKHGEIHDYTL